MMHYFWLGCAQAGACETAYQVGRLTMYNSLRDAGKLRGTPTPGGKLARRVQRNPRSP